jgi:hypothetical protein
MMYFAYPNAHLGQFVGCVRYLSLPPHQTPDPSYHEAKPNTPDFEAVHTAVRDLVPERAEQLDQGTVGQVYEQADQVGGWGGATLDFAYLLALVRCSRPLVLEACADLGDVWCIGEIGFLMDTSSLRAVDPLGFAAKLEGFLAQAHNGDRLLLVPSANVFPPQLNTCRAHQVQLLSLRAFRTALLTARTAASWPKPAVIHVSPRELELLVTTLFAPPQP